MAAKAQAEKEVVIRRPDLAECVVTIRGTSPLLQNRMSDDTVAGLTGEKLSAEKQAKNKTPEQRMKEALHTIDADAGRYGFPSEGVFRALISAGGRFTDRPMTEWRGVLRIPFGLLEIRGAGPELHFAMGWQKGIPMPVFRPIFREWELDVPVTYDKALVTRKELLELFERAGFSQGIGSFRPEKNGTFGTFQVKEATGAE